MTNPIATLATLIALTLPQRRALGAHLIAFAAQWKFTDGPLTVPQAERIAARLLAGTPTTGPFSDGAILEAAVYLNPARGLIPDRTLATLGRAWTKLGWTWRWPGDVEGGDTAACKVLIQAAEDRIRAIMAGPPAPVSEPERPAPVAHGTYESGGVFPSGTDHDPDDHGGTPHDSDPPATFVQGDGGTWVPKVPALDSVWVVIATGTWIKVVDTGTGSIHWTAISPSGDRGQTMTNTWNQNVTEGVIAPLFVVPFGVDPDTIHHSPTGVHPGSCRGCNANPQTWGKPVRVKCPNCGGPGEMVDQAPPGESGDVIACKADGDVQCSACSCYYFSGDGHPKIALCRRCWKGRDPHATPQGEPQAAPRAPDLDWGPNPNAAPSSGKGGPPPAVAKGPRIADPDWFRD